MKILDLKKGDKVFCIKTYQCESTRQIKRDNEYYERLNFFNNTEWSDLTENEKIEYSNFDFDKEKTEIYDKFIKGKVYTVTSKFGTEIEIEGEISSETFDISHDGDKSFFNFSKDESFLNEYFCSLIDGRKIKLEELNDKNFTNFLKKIKPVK